MKPIIAKEPMELLAIDFLSLKKGKGGFENILVVTDSFTKFLWACPTWDQKATTVAKLLWDNVCMRTRAGILRESSSKVCANLVEYINQRPAPTTHKVIGRQKGLTRPSLACWVPLPRTTSQDGLSS